jgi:hypothetical protein
MHKREHATRSLPSFRNITIDRNEMLLDSGVVLSLRIAAACVGCVEGLQVCFAGRKRERYNCHVEQFLFC